MLLLDSDVSETVVHAASKGLQKLSLHALWRHALFMRQPALTSGSECNLGDVHAEIHELCVTVVPTTTLLLRAGVAVLLVSWGNVFNHVIYFLIRFFTGVFFCIFSSVLRFSQCFSEIPSLLLDLCMNGPFFYPPLRLYLWTRHL